MATYYIPLCIQPWSTIKVSGTPFDVAIPKDEKTVGYIPVYTSLEDLKADMGGDSNYTTLVTDLAKKGGG